MSRVSKLLVSAVLTCAAFVTSAAPKVDCQDAADLSVFLFGQMARGDTIEDLYEVIKTSDATRTEEVVMFFLAHQAEKDYNVELAPTFSERSNILRERVMMMCSGGHIDDALARQGYK